MKRTLASLGIILAIIICYTPCIQASYKIKIQGQVTGLVSGKPLRNVNIASRGLLLGITDIDGKFSIQASPDTELLFNIAGYNDVIITVDNRQILYIQMTEREIKLPEVLVLGKEQNKKISAEPTDLEVKGNYFHLKTKLRAPTSIFKADKRFIIQPALYDATTNSYAYFRPVVIDGRYFEMNNERINNFDLNRDSLFRFQVDNTLKSQDNIYAYSDSIFVRPEAINHEFRAECYLAVNAFATHPRDYLDTVIIARGTKNPLRFIAFGFTPYELRDSTYYPRPEMNLITEKGISRIRFEVGQASINRSLGENEMELNKIRRTVSRVLSNEDETIRSISAIGYTSPEGGYEYNKLLAHKRTISVMNEIIRELPATHKPFIHFETSSQVEEWASVSALIRNDSLPWAGRFDSIISYYSNNSAKCQWTLKKMPEYRDIVVREYLPRLRRTEYVIEYSIFRNLKDEEIAARYASGKKSFSRYEYWRLCEQFSEKKTQTKVLKEALNVYPDFLHLANKYAIHLIQADSFNTAILKPAIDRDTPWEIKYNQAIMALGTRDFVQADSLSNTIPAIDEVAYLKAVVATLNGRYEEAYPIIASKGGLNEILILLCLNRNKEAEQRIIGLLDIPENTGNAHYWYIRAICANRNDSLTMAIESLRKALGLNPSLKEIAKKDSDIMDILELIDLEK